MTIVFMALSGPSLVVGWVVAAVAMLFSDAPDSSPGLVFAIIVSFTVVTAGCIATAIVLMRRGRFRWSAGISSLPVIITIGFFAMAGLATGHDWLVWKKRQKQEAVQEFSRLRNAMATSDAIFWDSQRSFIEVARDPDEVFGKRGRTVSLWRLGDDVKSVATIGKIVDGPTVALLGYDAAAGRLLLLASPASDKRDVITIDELRKFKNSGGRSLFDLYPIDPTGSTSKATWFNLR